MGENVPELFFLINSLMNETNGSLKFPTNNQ